MVSPTTFQNIGHVRPLFSGVRKKTSSTLFGRIFDRTYRTVYGVSFSNTSSVATIFLEIRENEKILASLLPIINSIMLATEPRVECPTPPDSEATPAVI